MNFFLERELSKKSVRPAQAPEIKSVKLVLLASPSSERAHHKFENPAKRAQKGSKAHAVGRKQVNDIWNKLLFGVCEA